MTRSKATAKSAKGARGPRSVRAPSRTLGLNRDREGADRVFHPASRRWPSSFSFDPPRLATLGPGGRGAVSGAWRARGPRFYPTAFAVLDRHRAGNQEPPGAFRQYLRASMPQSLLLLRVFTTKGTKDTKGAWIVGRWRGLTGCGGETRGEAGNCVATGRGVPGLCSDAAPHGRLCRLFSRRGAIGDFMSFVVYFVLAKTAWGKQTDHVGRRRCQRTLPRSQLSF